MIVNGEYETEIINPSNAERSLALISASGDTEDVSFDSITDSTIEDIILVFSILILGEKA